MTEANRHIQTIAACERSLHEAQQEIDKAYWLFTRTSNAKPPILVCPEAYKRKREAQLQLRRLRIVRADSFEELCAYWLRLGYTPLQIQFDILPPWHDHVVGYTPALLWELDAIRFRKTLGFKGDT